MRKSSIFNDGALATILALLNLLLLLLLAATAAAEQGELQNWSLVSTIVPAPPSTISPTGSFAYAKPTTVAEVQAIVGDTSGTYPSPVLTVGSGHSSGNVVSVVNPSTNVYSGTILQMTEISGMALEEVDASGTGVGGSGGSPGKRLSRRIRRRRLEGATVTVSPESTPPTKKYFVRVGGGVTLTDLHDWLAERNLEISFR